MSSRIDERIVEMQFDNKQFEDGVKETTRTLDNFKKQLKFEGAEKSFQEIENASKNVKLNGISAAVDELNNKFSALGVMAATAIQNITNKMVNALTNMVSSVTIAPITNGFNKYEEKLKATQVILNSITDETKKNMEYVGSQLDRIALFTDETSYSFTDMVNNIGKFSASNVELEKAVTAMQGISTWAARAGASVTEAGRAMYNLSQSIGMGYVATMDWKSIENANMATAEFKRIALEAGVAIGTLVKKSEDLYATLDGDEVTVENFRNTLQEKWFTADTLIKALDEYGRFADLLMRRIEEFDGAFTASEMVTWIEDYKDGTLEIQEVVNSTGLSIQQVDSLLKELSDDSLDFSREAFKAAFEARTFGDAIAATVDAVSTKWMTMFELIFGNYEQAKVLWTDLSMALWDIFAGPIDSINNELKKWAKADENGLSGQKEFLRGIYALGKAIYNIIMNVRNAFSTIFPPIATERLVALTTKFADFSEKVRDATEFVGSYVKELVEEVSKPVEGVAKTFDNVTEAVENTTEEIDKFANAVIAGIYGNGVDRRKALEQLGQSYEAIQNRVNELLGSSFRYRDEEGNIITSTKKLIDVNVDAADSVEEVNEALAETDSGKLATELDETSESSDKLNTIGQKLHDTLVGMFSIFRIFSEALGALNKHIVMPLIKTLIPAILNGILSITSGIGKAATEFMYFVSEAKIFDTIFGTIAKTFKTVFSSFKEFVAKIKELKSVQTTIEHVQKFFEFLSDIKNDIFEGFSKLFTDIGELGSKANFVDHMVDAFDRLVGIFNNLLVFTSPVTMFFGGILKSISSFFRNINFKGLQPVLNWVINFINNFISESGKVFAYLGKNMNQIFKLILSFSKDYVDEIFGASFDEFVNKFGEMHTILQTILPDLVKMLDIGAGFESLKPLLDQLMGSVGEFFSPLASVLPKIKNGLSGIWEVLKNLFENFNIYYYVNLIKSGVVIASIFTFAKLLNSLSKVFSGIGDVLYSVEGMFKSIKHKFEASAFTSLAIAIGIISGALYLLSTADKEGLERATVAVFLMSAIVMGFAGILAEVTKLGTGKDFALGASAIVAISGSLLIMAGALKLMSSLPWDEYFKAIIQLGLLVGVMLGVLYVISKLAKYNTFESGKGTMAVLLGLLFFASAVQKLVESLIMLADMDLKKLKDKIVPLLGIVGVLTLLAVAAGKMSFGGSIGLLANVAAIWLFVKILQNFEKINFDKLNGTLLKMIPVFLTLLGLSFIARKAGMMLIGVGSAFAGMGVAIYLIVQSIKALKGIKFWDLAKATAVIAAIMFLLTEFTKVALIASGGDTIRRFAGLSLAFISLSIAIGIIVGVIYLLSKVKDKTSIVIATGIIGLLLWEMIALAKAASAASGATKALIACVVLIGTLAAALWALSFFTKDGKVIEVAGSLALVIAALAGAIWTISMIKMESIGKSILTLGMMLVLLGGVGAILYLLTNNVKNADTAIKIAQSLAIALTTIAVLAFIAQAIDPVAATKGALAMDAVILLIGGLALIIDAVLKHFNMDLSSVERGLDVLVLIGVKLGEFIGGILGGLVGGIASGASYGLATMAENLGDFGEKIAPFLEFVKTLDDGTSNKIQILGDLFTSIATLNFNKLKDNNDLENAISVISVVFETLRDLNIRMRSIHDTSKLEIAVEMIKKLAEANSILDSNISYNLPGFVSEMPSVGEALSVFAGYLEGYDQEAIDAKIDSVVKLVTSLASIEIPSSGGLIEFFTGTTDWASFGEGLVQFATSLTGFSRVTGNLTPDQISQLDTVIEISKKLAELKSAIPGTTDDSHMSIKEIWGGDNSWAAFGRGLVSYAQALINFGGTLSALGEDKIANIDNAIAVSYKLGELQNSMNTIGGVIAFFEGENDFGTFGEKLATYGLSLRSFSNSLYGLNLLGVESAINVTKQYVELSNMTMNGDNLANFGRGISGLGNSLKHFYEYIKGNEISELANITDYLKAFIQGIDSVSGAVGTTVTNIVEEAMDILVLSVGDFGKAGTDSANAYIDGLETAYGDAAVAGTELSEKGAAGADNKSPAWKTAGENAGTGFIKGLSSMEEFARSAGAAIAGAALQGARSTLDEHSPSKEMYRIGSFGGEGFVNGLLNWIDGAANASDELAMSTLDSLNSTIANVINNELDTEPIIKPRLDLSNIVSGARAINSMMNANELAYANGTDLQNSNQNGGNGMTFIQNNYSPKALSQIDIYRQTKNQFAQAKGLVTGR